MQTTIVRLAATSVMRRFCRPGMQGVKPWVVRVAAEQDRMSCATRLVVSGCCAPVEAHLSLQKHVQGAVIK